MNEPNFILTRFTHGSAGKFLSSVLQTSAKIDHWSAIIESNKSTDLFERLILEYTKRSFPSDHSLHMQMEPMVPYNTDLYSSGYPRGNDVTLDQYLAYAIINNDYRLLNCMKNNLFVNIIFHKPCIPIFCLGANVITITVTSDSEKQWLYKTLWSKQFLETDNEILYLPSDPEYCNFSSIISVLKFNNPYKFDKSLKDKLFEKYVINDYTNQWYFEPDKFSKYDSDYQLDNTFIQLDEILVVNKFLLAMTRIFDYYCLGNPDLQLIKKMHQIWLSRQHTYDL